MAQQQRLRREILAFQIPSFTVFSVFCGTETKRKWYLGSKVGVIPNQIFLWRLQEELSETGFKDNGTKY